MFFSGIADEAAPQLTRQIAAHKALGWNHIGLRNIDGTNATDISDADFDLVASQLEENGFGVSCFASQLANWSRPIDSDLQTDIDELQRATKRMARFKTPFIRCMSYPNSKPPLEDGAWRKETVRRLKVLAKIAEDSGVILVHENCSG